MECLNAEASEFLVAQISENLAFLRVSYTNFLTIALANEKNTFCSKICLD